MADPLLLFNVDVEVADHHNAAFGSYAFLAATELTRLHVAFQDG